MPNEQDLQQQDLDAIYQRTLGAIDSIMQASGRRLSDFPTLPQECRDTHEESMPPTQVLIRAEHTQYDQYEQALQDTELVHTLNDDQRAACDAIITSIAEQSSDPHVSRLFFINGPGATGKSQVFKTFLTHVCFQQEIALPVASSGIAAILLPGGRTAHSRFKIPARPRRNKYLQHQLDQCTRPSYSTCLPDRLG